MKNFLLFIFSCCLSLYMHAQSGFAWAKQFGDSGGEQGFSIALDKNGNVYSTGSFSNTVDFDPGNGNYNLSEVGGGDIFISKLTANGDFVWAKRMGGLSTDIAYSIAIDKSNNIYTTGFFRGTADFDPGSGVYNLISEGGTDIFISKLDSAGNFVWAKQIGGQCNQYAKAVTLDSLGNIYLTGGFYCIADFDPDTGTYNLSSANYDDMFVLKLDSLANFVWAKQIGNTGGGEGLAITIDDIGNVYTTGCFQYTCDFDPGTGIYNLTATLGYGNAFVLKLNVNGDFVFARQLGEGGAALSNSIALDKGGNILTTGYFAWTSDFDPGTGSYNFTSVGPTDIFISKLDSLGNFLWAKQIGANGWDQGNALAIDSNNNIYITGGFVDTVDFDPGFGMYYLPNTLEGIFVVELSPSGSFVCAGGMGSGGYTSGNSIALGNDAQLYLTGSFSGTIDFDPTLGSYFLSTSPGNDMDAFVCKLKMCSIQSGGNEIFNSDFISIYPNPSSGNFTVNLPNCQAGAKVIVRDVLGNCLLVKDCRGESSQEINLSCQPRGIYFVELLSGEDRIVKKVAIQ